MRRFLFMVLDEHPWGREMLARLLEAGHVPELVVIEASPIAEAERHKFLARLGDHPAATALSVQLAEADLASVTVPAHTDRHCLDPVRDADPDLMVLGGTRILHGELLRVAPDGVLNSHPGLLPECRGSASPAWSVYHDIPIGSSCHFCTSEIDAGDLVGRRRIEVRRGMTYEDLCHLTLVEAARLMVEALTAWRDGRLEALRRTQGPSPHPTFRNMPQELLEVVRAKLREGTYAHFSG